MILILAPLEYLVLEEIFRYTYDDFYSRVDQLAPKIVAINNLISDGNFSTKIKHDFVSVQTEHIHIHYKIKDIHDNLEEMSELDEQKISEFYISEHSPLHISSEGSGYDSDSNLDDQVMDRLSNNKVSSPRTVPLIDPDEYVKNEDRDIDFKTSQTINHSLKQGIELSPVAISQALSSTNPSTVNNGNISDIQSLIEMYEKYFEDMDDQLGMMRNTLDVLLRIIDINISEKRNQIAKFDIKLNIVTLGVAFATFVSSSFGMNLQNHLEDMDAPFFVVNALMVIIVILIYIIVDRAFKRIVK